MLEQKLSTYEHWNGFRDFSYQNLRCGYHDGLLSWDELHFKDQLNVPLLSGNELFFYPKLTNKLREVADYPVISRKYKIPEEILNSKGIAVLEQLTTFAKKCQRQFLRERDKISLKVSKVITKYSTERTEPVITDLHLLDGSWRRHPVISSISIGGVDWVLSNVASDCDELKKIINLNRLTELYHNSIKRLDVEVAIKGSSIIGIRLFTSDPDKTKGRLAWFDLGKLEFVKENQIRHLLNQNTLQEQ